VRTLKSCDTFEGAPFVLECQISGSPSPTVSWFRENENIDSCPDYVITKINGTCTLRTKSSKAEHAARYTCLAVNSAGEASSTAKVNVIRKDCMIASSVCYTPPHLSPVITTSLMSTLKFLRGAHHGWGAVGGPMMAVELLVGPSWLWSCWWAHHGCGAIGGPIMAVELLVLVSGLTGGDGLF